MFERRITTLVAAFAVLLATGAGAAAAAAQGGPPVKGAGVGTPAALASPACEESTGLTEVELHRAPAVRASVRRE